MDLGLTPPLPQCGKNPHFLFIFFFEGFPYLISVIKVERPRKRENVIRCKQYRIKKKNEMIETERNLEDLSRHNEKLKEREMALDSSLEFLHKTYFELIKKNCDCEKVT